MEDSIQSMMKSKREARYSRNPSAEHERFFKSVTDTEAEMGFPDAQADDSSENESGQHSDELITQLTQFLDELEEDYPEEFDEILNFLEETLDLSDEELDQIFGAIESTPHEDEAEAEPIGKSAGFRVAQPESFRQVMQRGAFKKRTSYYGADPVTAEEMESHKPVDPNIHNSVSRRRSEEIRQNEEAKENWETKHKPTPEQDEAAKRTQAYVDRASEAGREELRERQRREMPGYSPELEAQVAQNPTGAPPKKNEPKAAETKDGEEKKEEAQAKPAEEKPAEAQAQPQAAAGDNMGAVDMDELNRKHLQEKIMANRAKAERWAGAQAERAGNRAALYDPNNTSRWSRFRKLLHAFGGAQRDEFRQALARRKKQAFQTKDAMLRNQMAAIGQQPAAGAEGQPAAGAEGQPQAEARPAFDADAARRRGAEEWRRNNTPQFN